MENRITSECVCGGETVVKTTQTFTGMTYDVHCTACGNTVQVSTAHYAPVRVTLEEKYRRATDP